MLDDFESIQPLPNDLLLHLLEFPDFVIVQNLGDSKVHHVEQVASDHQADDAREKSLGLVGTHM